MVQDWMINANYGVDAENPTLSQVRFQLGYRTERNERSRRVGRMCEFWTTRGTYPPSARQPGDPWIS